MAILEQTLLKKDFCTNFLNHFSYRVSNILFVLLAFSFFREGIAKLFVISQGKDGYLQLALVRGSNLQLSVCNVESFTIVYFFFLI